MPEAMEGDRVDCPPAGTAVFGFFVVLPDGNESARGQNEVVKLVAEWTGSFLFVGSGVVRPERSAQVGVAIGAGGEDGIEIGRDGQVNGFVPLAREDVEPLFFEINGVPAKGDEVAHAQTGREAADDHVTPKIVRRFDVDELEFGHGEGAAFDGFFPAGLKAFDAEHRVFAQHFVGKRPAEEDPEDIFLEVGCAGGHDLAARLQPGAKVLGGDILEQRAVRSRADVFAEFAQDRGVPLEGLFRGARGAFAEPLFDGFLEGVIGRGFAAEGFVNEIEHPFGTGLERVDGGELLFGFGAIGGACGARVLDAIDAFADAPVTGLRLFVEPGHWFLSAGDDDGFVEGLSDAGNLRAVAGFEGVDRGPGRGNSELVFRNEPANRHDERRYEPQAKEEERSFFGAILTGWESESAPKRRGT